MKEGDQDGEVSSSGNESPLPYMNNSEVRFHFQNPNLHGCMERHSSSLRSAFSFKETPQKFAGI